MQIQVVKSKIHRVTVTGADLNYIGSITIDERLMQAANIIEGERVQIVNINNGERLETYVIKGDYNSGTICLNPSPIFCSPFLIGNKKPGGGESILFHFSIKSRSTSNAEQKVFFTAFANAPRSHFSPDF